MRLLIAMNVLLALPDRIVKHPELYNLGGKKPAEVRDAVAKLHASLIGTRGITYTRSDGSAQKLTVADLLARRAALEIAYNPNDCVEIRWGAPRGLARGVHLQAPPSARPEGEDGRIPRLVPRDPPPVAMTRAWLALLALGGACTGPRAASTPWVVQPEGAAEFSPEAIAHESCYVV